MGTWGNSQIIVPFLELANVFHVHKKSAQYVFAWIFFFKKLTDNGFRFLSPEAITGVHKTDRKMTNQTKMNPNANEASRIKIQSSMK